MEAFLMALRLRNSGVVYPDVEAVFGQIIIALVKTATHMLIHDEPEIRVHRDFLLSEDSQQQLAMLLLEKLNLVDTTKKSHIVFTYIKNIVQTRARNLVRDSHAAKRDVRKSSRFEDLEVAPIVTDFYGDKRATIKNCKVSNNQKEH